MMQCEDVCEDGPNLECMSIECVQGAHAHAHAHAPVPGACACAHDIYMRVLRLCAASLQRALFVPIPANSASQSLAAISNLLLTIQNSNRDSIPYMIPDALC